MKRLVIVVLIIIAAVAGFWIFRQRVSRNGLRSTVVDLCGGDAPCVAAVATHFDPCFEQATSQYGRLALTTPRLAQCVDRKVAEATMADMRTIASSWEAYATDYNSYLPNGRSYDQSVPGLGDPISLDRAEMMDRDTLASFLTPTYARAIPQRDGWGHDLEFAVSRGGDEYLLRSTGRDGKADADSYSRGKTLHADCDIVYSQGTFVVAPDGASQK